MQNSQLRDKQAAFAREIALLILHAERAGYTVTFGDAYRDPRAFGALHAPAPYGHPSSKHKLRLAVDLNVFRDGAYLWSGEQFEDLGHWWESRGNIWGGRFQDGNHFEAPNP